MSELPKPPKQDKLSNESEKSLKSLSTKNPEKRIDQDKERKDLGEMDEGLAMMRDSEYYDKALIKPDSDIFQKALQEEKGKFGGAKEDLNKSGAVEESINNSSEDNLGSDDKNEKENKPNNSEEFNPFSGKFGDAAENVFKGEGDQEKTGKTFRGRRLGTKESVKNEKEPSEVEKLKQEADELFQKVLGLEGDFQKTKNNRSLFDKTKALFGFGKSEDGHINKEFLDNKKALEEAKEKYQAKYQEFANKKVAEKREELVIKNLSENEKQDSLKRFILAEKFLTKKEKAEDGSEIENKFTLLEYLNNNEKEVLKKRQEVLPEKKKGSIQKMMDWYSGLSPTKKTIYGVGISAGIGATAMLAGGAAVSTALGYGAWKGGKTLLRRVLIGSTIGATAKGLNSLLTETNRLNNKIDFYKKSTDIVSGFENEKNDLFQILNKYNVKEKRRETKRRLIVVGTTIALFGTALGAEALMAGEIPETGVVEKAIHPRPENFTIQADPGELEQSVKLENLHEKVEGKNSGLGSGQNVEDLAELHKETLGDGKFELKPKGSVWGSLNEHFSGNRQEVGKVLADFKGRTVEDLIKNHGMDQIQANKFVEWRYRNLGEGTVFALNGEGKLEFPEFANEGKIAQFEGQSLSEGAVKSPGVETVDIKDPDKAIDDFNKRKSIPPTPREDLTPDTQATVEILDPEVSAKIDNQVDVIVNQKVQEIYKYWGGNQVEEWSTMKNKMAEDILNQKYGDSIGAQLDSVEVDNREELRNYLVQLTTEVDSVPRAGETVEEFIQRAERAKITGDFSENVDVVNNSSLSAKVTGAEDLNNQANSAGNNSEALGSWGKTNSLEVLENGDPKTKDYVRSLIKRANMIPGENQSLQDFARMAEDKIDGARVPQTEMDYTLSKIFGRWTDAKIDQWMEMREYSASDLMRQGLNPRFTSVEMNNWREMSDHLNNLRSQFGNPVPGESVSDYLERVGNENSTPKKFFTSGNRRPFRSGLGKSSFPSSRRG